MVFEGLIGIERLLLKVLKDKATLKARTPKPPGAQFFLPEGGEMDPPIHGLIG